MAAADCDGQVLGRGLHPRCLRRPFLREAAPNGTSSPSPPSDSFRILSVVFFPYFFLITFPVDLNSTQPLLAELLKRGQQRAGSVLVRQPKK
jgi:hypothetical protein